MRTASSTVAVTGAPGPARSALVRDIAGRLEVTRIDAADLAREGEQSWIARMVELVLTHEGVLTIENVEHLPPPQQVVLGRILTGTAARARLVITAAPDTGASPTLTSLLSRCVDHLEL
ncbi:hypothetical protein [Rhodococcus tukisamuensis]|uniref:hypothetical protein n=1 Tax=Rhodococcus tukisamuensis TaxID=168276 RepID=UPI00093459C0|nr:hypothetical protein [Rhodococcus tukisamuensis]